MGVVGKIKQIGGRRLEEKRIKRRIGEHMEVEEWSRENGKEERRKVKDGKEKKEKMNGLKAEDD